MTLAAARLGPYEIARWARCIVHQQQREMINPGLEWRT